MLEQVQSRRSVAASGEIRDADSTTETRAPETPISGPSLWRKHGLFVCVVTSLVYLQSLAFPFLVLDDAAFIVRNPVVHSWSRLPSYFIGSSDPALPVLGFYRPLAACGILLRYEFFGLHPSLWHLSCVVLYALGVWLLWRLAWELTRDEFCALIAATLYGLHPLHVEGVVWLSGATIELLLNIFFLAAFLAYLAWRKQPSIAHLCVCAGLTLCALFSKETALALPMLIVAHWFIVRQRTGANKNQVQSGAILAGAMGTVVCLYFLLRTLAIHTVVTSRPLHSWAEIVRTAPLLFVTYLRQAFWPVHLAMWHDTQVVRSVSQASFYIPAILCVIYFTLMIWAIAHKPLVGFLLAWWAVSLAAPIAGLRVFPENDIIHDRFSFVALAGLCILAGLAARRLPVGGPSFLGLRAPQAALLAGIVLLLGTLTIAQVNTWRNDMAMYAQAVEISPKSLQPRILLANEFLKRGDLNRALALDREALAIDPNHWETLFSYGMTLNAAGNRLQALQALYGAIKANPSQAVLYYAAAKNLAEMGRLDEAARVLESGIATAQDAQTLQRPLADVRALQQRFQESRQP